MKNLFFVLAAAFFLTTQARAEGLGSSLSQGQIGEAFSASYQRPIQGLLIAPKTIDFGQQTQADDDCDGGSDCGGLPGTK